MECSEESDLVGLFRRGNEPEPDETPGDEGSTLAIGEARRPLRNLEYNLGPWLLSMATSGEPRRVMTDCTC